ncbi:MAG: hypothetical protein KDB03_07520 [Planctomycetales bacterium]|nr:hypothetical protein [Planctomycetales bacterium]
MHRDLKRLYADNDSSIEVVIDGFRIDAVASCGELIEIQHASLGALRSKTHELLGKARRRLRIVKPIIASKRVTTVDGQGSQVRSRMSPKKCDILEYFMELVHFSNTFPRPRLTLEILLIEAEEIRQDRVGAVRRRKKYRTLDQRFLGIVGKLELRNIGDVLATLPMSHLPNRFDTAEMAAALDRPRWFGQKVAYCLRQMGAVEICGKRGNSQLYKLKPRYMRAVKRDPQAA